MRRRRISLLEKIANGRITSIAAGTVALAGAAYLAGCDGTSQNNNDAEAYEAEEDTAGEDAYEADTEIPTEADVGEEDAPATVSVSGSATDGPYINGSQVTIVRLGTRLEPTTDTIIQWTDELGRYSATLQGNKNYLVSVLGFNFDEITGLPSAAQIEMKAFFRTGASPAEEYNANDVTKLVSERVKKLVEEGIAFDAADTQALNELLAQTPMIIATPDCHTYEMDIISGANNCNNPLLAYEILVRQWAHTESATTGAPVDAILQDKLNSVSFEFATSGTLSDTTKAALWEAARTADIQQAEQNLDDYFAAHGGTAVRPSAWTVIDSDGDGETNATDCLPYDSSRWTGHADGDSDGHDHIACGGDDCDDDNGGKYPGNTEVCGNDVDEDCSGAPNDLDCDGHDAIGIGGDDCDDECATCYPGATESCGEAMDHDCDGLIDELNGCGVCDVGVPSVVGSLPLELRANSLYVLSDTAFLSDLNALRVIDLSDPINPSLITSLEVGPRSRISVLRNNLYGASIDGFFVIDITTPSSPEIVGDHSPIGAIEINGVSLSPSENKVYVASNLGIHIFDVSDPRSPTLISSSAETASGVFVNGITAYVTYPEGVRIIRHTSSDGIRTLYSLEGFVSNDVYVSENRAFIATERGLSVFDVASPEAPRSLAGLPTDEPLWKLFVAGSRAFAISNAALYLVDVSNPEIPSLISRTPNSLSNAPLFVSGRYAYMVGDSGTGTFYVVDLDCRD